MRRGVRQILDEAYVDAAVTEAESGERAVDCVRVEGFDLVLLDISAAGSLGPGDHRAHPPGTPPASASSCSACTPRNSSPCRHFRAGASGYMTKDHASDLLLAAISRIMSGGRYLSPALAEILAGQVAGDLDGPPHGRLSTREFRVMCNAGGRTRAQPQSRTNSACP